MTEQMNDLASVHGVQVNSQEASKFLQGVDPRNGQRLEPVQVTDPDSLRDAVARARTAQPGWHALDFSERSRILKRAAKRMLAERRDCLAIVEQELGKVPADALFTEALGPLDALTGWVKVIQSAPAGKVALNPVAFPKKDARIELVPRGVVGVVAPWNFPVAGLYRSVFPALLLGNSVVLKPSEHSPRSSAWFARMLQAELPASVLELVQGGSSVGEALVEADIDACVFTGSTAVGQKVERRCIERGIAVSAEMGGNDAAIVLHDADLSRTVAGLTHWALQNAGQACGAVEVVYADSRIAKELTARLADAFRRLQAAPEPGLSGSVAPIAHQSQLDGILAQLDDAREKGAEVLCGGAYDGLFLQPTILASCTDEMSVVREETFGPVLPVIAVDGAADGVRRVNKGRYGLTASIWTSDITRAEQLAEQLDVGVVTINNHAFTGAISALPWSGRRDSGRGIANSAWSLLTFARPKAIVIDRSSGPEPFWVPLDDDLIELGHLLADAQRGRIARAFKIPLLLRKRIAHVKAFFGMR